MAVVEQIIKMTKADLHEFVADIEEKKAKAEAYDKFYNILVPISWIETVHKVNAVTVRRYIERGLIIPEERQSRTEHYKFRLSYVLRLDFHKLRRQLKSIR
ncbi:hypothetical protein [Parabacteroides pacaensis]|uniref:hypothetical protein n=1 Tax=Parabacteroides pacaensis TaxID=2086575 RepID=UPI000D0F9A90|nr:hypothetical protein [Parabacteroides pacaensis]